ncbi:MAG TPA: response regulator transcription factor [Myxococcota bacterium]|nr:response regulator transcription factor [Myxococcales bacterium]HPG24104.1 response regulator transcription factor [Myxococcota bacterium]
MTHEPIAVYVADDHEIVRRGIATLLGQQPDLEIAGQAETAEALLTAARPGAWDVLILDLALGGSSDVKLVRQLKEAHPYGRILVYTAQREGPLALEILRGGADGYLSKTRSLDELLYAVRAVHRDGRFVTAPIAELLFQAPVSGDEEPPLTGRELHVLERLVRGERPSEIGVALGIQPSTISSHLKAIRRKVGAASNAELVRYYERRRGRL